MNQTMAAAEWAVLLLTATMFGSSFFFINIAVDTIPPLTLAAGRVVVAAPLAWALLRMAGGRLPALGPEWIPLVVLGALTAAIPYVAIAWGQVHLESGLAGILFGTIPVFTVILAPLLVHDEVFTPSRLAGVAVGLSGVVLVIGPKALGGLGEQLLGATVTIVAALSYALGGIYARRRREIAPAVMAAGQLVVAAVMLVPLSLAFDAPWDQGPTRAALGAVVAVAILSTALPAFLLFWLIQRVGAIGGSLLAFFIPIVAVVLGTAVLGEHLPWPAFVGMGLILAGAAGVTGQIRLTPSRRPAASEPAGGRAKSA